ncbi:MAG: CPBP family intramembrane metalloprotease [Deltaproteobacteria bacterium]|nr:CPBP family intramembrane metalloprotease [Deltaproteobacteria bacterium]
MKKRSGWRTFLFLVALAFGLWVLAFAIPAGNFWIKISVSAAILASLSLMLRKEILSDLRFNTRSFIIGISAAIALYFIFMIGREVSLQLFGFAGNKIGDIYAKGAGTQAWVISILLFFITGPSEEIFWRGFLQKGLQERLGGWKGYLLATSLYTGVHICSMNFILIGAALVAGAFWGAFYWRTDNLAAAIISHSVWSTAIFTILPLL